MASTDTPPEPKSDECAHCMFETTELTWTERLKMNGSGERMERTQAGWLCEVCRSTVAGNLFLYGGEDAQISSVVAWGINHLASLIKAAP